MSEICITVRVIFVFWELRWKILRKCNGCISVVLSNRSREAEAILSDRTLTCWISGIIVIRPKFVQNLLLVFVTASASSPLQLSQNSKFIFCLFVCNCVWSRLLCSFCDIEHVIFEYLFHHYVTSVRLLSCRYLVWV